MPDSLPGGMPGSITVYAPPDAAVVAMTGIGRVSIAPPRAATRSGERERRSRLAAEGELGGVRAVLGGAVHRVGVRAGLGAPRVVGEVGLGAGRAPQDEQLVVDHPGRGHVRRLPQTRPAKRVTRGRARG